MGNLKYTDHEVRCVGGDLRANGMLTGLEGVIYTDLLPVNVFTHDGQKHTSAFTKFEIDFNGKVFLRTFNRQYQRGWLTRLAARFAAEVFNSQLVVARWKA